MAKGYGSLLYQMISYPELAAILHFSGSMVLVVQPCISCMYAYIKGLVVFLISSAKFRYNPKASPRFSKIPNTSVAAVRHNTTRNPRDALRVRVSRCVTPRSVGRGRHPGRCQRRDWCGCFFSCGGGVFLEVRNKA